jgi:arylsulfatase A-like enzyme/Flp pilus assembly protein TadD
LHDNKEIPSSLKRARKGKTAGKRKSVKRRKFGILIAFIGLLSASFLIYHLLLKSRELKPGKVVRNSRANVLLITLDTTRADRIGAYGYCPAKTPAIDRVAKEGVLFKNTYAPVPLTLPSHASILTGTYPLFHGVRNNGKYLLNPAALTLAEILQEAGYSTSAFVSSFILDSRFGLDQGFEDYGDIMEDAAKVKNLESERRAATTFTDFKEWFEKNSQRKFFSWVHFFDPHYPYDPPEPYKSDRAFSHPYEGEIAYMDFYVGEVLRLLRQKNVYGRTLVILAGDHGEAFGEHQENGHTIFCYEENLRVPLIISCSEGLPKNLTIPQPVNLIDIFPSILDFLKIKPPRFVQGKSLIPLLEGRKFAQRPFYFESLYGREVLGCSPLTGLLLGPWKYIQLPTPELYDLGNDPQEKNNLAASRLPQVQGMKKNLAEIETEFGRSGLEAQRKMSDEERRRLESLGYLAASGKKTAVLSNIDPKERIGFWNKSLLAKQMISESRYDEAEKLLLGLWEEDSRFNPVIEDLAELYFTQNKKDSLMALFEKGLAAEPGDGALRIHYASYLVRLDLPEKAIAVLKDAEALADLDQQEFFYFVLGNAWGKLGRYEEAVRALKKALEIEPQNYEAFRLLGYTMMQLGQFSDALVYFSEAEKGIPDDPRLLEDLAMTYAELKEFVKARGYFERALIANPSARIYYHYALLSAQSGNYSLALELIEKALAAPDVDEDLRHSARALLQEWKVKR